MAPLPRAARRRALRRGAPLTALLLTAAGAAACRPRPEPGGAVPPLAQRVGKPVKFPNARKPNRPPGGRPTSCSLLRGPDGRSHWEQQSALFSRLVTALGVGTDKRVATAVVTMAARPGLEALGVESFVGVDQAIAEVELADEHNGVRAGRYCLTLAFEDSLPPVGTPAHATAVNDPARWRMLLYAMTGAPTARAVAWVPFVARWDPANLPGHDKSGRPPYPPARFDLALDARLSPTGQPAGARSPAMRAALAVTAWGMCGNGCCSGALEALEAY